MKLNSIVLDTELTTSGVPCEPGNELLGEINNFRNSKQPLLHMQFITRENCITWMCLFPLLHRFI